MYSYTLVCHYFLEGRQYVLYIVFVWVVVYNIMNISEAIITYTKRMMSLHTNFSKSFDPTI